MSHWPDGHPVALTADPSGCAVAVGHVSNGYQLRPELWQSDDCSHFSGRPIPDPCPPGCEIPREGKAPLTAVTTLPDGTFLAVGYVEERNDEFPAEMQVLHSPDGSEWQSIPTPSALTDHQYAYHVLVTQAGTAVIAGYDGGGKVWRSTDLAVWSEVTLPLPGGEPAATWTSAAAVYQAGDGTLVAVGQVGRPGTYDAAIWVSTDDGQMWTAVDAVGPLTPTVDSIESLHSVINLDQGIDPSINVDDVDQHGWLAVGRAAHRPAIWRSSDGLSWTADDTSWLPPGASVTNAAAGNHGLLVVGSVTTDGTTRPVAWLSTDGGSTWTERRVDGTGRVTAALATESGFVLVGGDGSRPGWATLLVPRRSSGGLHDGEIRGAAALQTTAAESYGAR